MSIEKIQKMKRKELTEIIEQPIYKIQKKKKKDLIEIIKELTEIIKKLKSRLIENIVIIFVIALGLIGSIIILACKLPIPPIVVAILLGAAIATLVYRFLGGISPDTTLKVGAFNVGTLKVGGTMAALIGSALLFNNILERQTRDLDNLFKPNYENWIAVSKDSGTPIGLKVIGVGKIPLPNQNIFSEILLTVQKDGDYFQIFSKKNTNFPLGKLSPDDFNRLESIISFGDKLKNFIVTDRLESGVSNCMLGQLPLMLSTKSYDNNYSNYVLLNRAGEEAYESGLQGREAEIVEIDSKYYFVAVVEVNHQPEKGNPYAKFAIGEIKPKIAL